MSTPLHVVFGAGGPLGNALARLLVERGRRVRAVNRRGVANLPDGVERVHGDAADPESTRRACAGAAVVYHCAGAPYAEWPSRLPVIMHGIIEGAAAAGATLVYGDNVYMYGPVSGPIRENLPDAPTGSKGITRGRIARTLAEAHRSGRVRATIGRASDFFGPGATLSAMGDRVFRAALAGRPASVLGRVELPHTYTYIDDFAAALITLGERKEALGQVWHVPSAETLTTREFLAIVFEEAGTPLRVRAASRRLVNVLGIFRPVLRELKETFYQFDAPFIVDHGKFAGAFGASPTPHREAIRRTLAWYRMR